MSFANPKISVRHPPWLLGSILFKFASRRIECLPTGAAPTVTMELQKARKNAVDGDRKQYQDTLGGKYFTVG